MLNQTCDYSISNHLILDIECNTPNKEDLTMDIQHLTPTEKDLFIKTLAECYRRLKAAKIEAKELTKDGFQLMFRSVYKDINNMT